MTISSFGTMKKASSAATTATSAYRRLAAAATATTTTRRGLLSAVAPPPAVAATSPNNTVVLPALQLLTKPQSQPPPSSSKLNNIIKHGIGRITASYDDDIVSKTTRLTRVSHKAPTRLIPLHNKTSIDKSSGTIVALSTYGGGMLQGDKSSIEIQVDQNACLGIITQGCNRIYKKKTKKQQRQDGVEPNNTKHHRHHHPLQYCQSTLEANVDDGGLLVIAPDPCSLFAQSSYRQMQRIKLGQTSNLILLDWFSSGRYKNGEYWDFDNLHAQTQLYVNDVLVLQDTTRMDLTIRNAKQSDSDGNVEMVVETDPAYIGVGNDDCHTFATLILYGDQVNLVESRCWQLKEILAKQKTRIRERSGGLVVKEEELSDVNGHHLLVENENDTGRLEALLDSFAGNVYMGISPVNVPSSSSSSSTDDQKQKQVHVIRMAATTNEDIYRIMNYVLKPMKSTFGLEYYKDRIRAGQSEIPIVGSNQKEEEEPIATDTPITTRMKNNPGNTQTTTTTTPALTDLWEEFYKQNPMYGTDTNNGNSSPAWSSFILSDSAFPIGSFAHSGGLEAAVQLNKIQSTKDLEDFVQAAIRSTLQQTIPFILESHKLITVAQQQHQQQEKIGTVVDDDDMDTDNQWKLLNQMCNAVLCGNSIACSASLDQGKSLARVAEQWLSSSSEEEELSDSTSASAKNDNGIHFLTEQQMNSSLGLHLGPTYGAVTASLNIDPKQSCELFGYCLGRDIVSAAVRLNLIGPIKSVRLLEKIQSSVQVGIEASLHALLQEQQEGHHREGDDDATRVHDPAGPAFAAGAAAGTSAPVLEAIHPCHDILQTRLFRS